MKKNVFTSDGINSILDPETEKISKTEDITKEIIQNESERKKPEEWKNE